MPDRGDTLAVARRGVFDAHRRAGAIVWVQATGGSMRPLVRPGDWMHVDFGVSAPRIGEIALFDNGTTLVAHRVVDRRRRDGRCLLVCKGDAVAFCDPAVAPEQILGVVRALRAEGAAASRATGCAGIVARAVAGVSRWSGRCAWWARRLSSRFPSPVTAAACSAIARLGLVLTRATAGLVGRLGLGG